MNTLTTFMKDTTTLYGEWMYLEGNLGLEGTEGITTVNFYQEGTRDVKVSFSSIGRGDNRLLSNSSNNVFLLAIQSDKFGIAKLYTINVTA